ncbi:MBL fold metallo-hydrolase [Xanthomonas hyacinthi]|uniref:MBL fold metallo-hydrolase n=1 Tax=Xanthomonas hyacinthi TaxID=56455 RepID=A0A2S7EUU8_9XANT|nr:MBL fold metallo-hydrolase [Xanthomonas hyacinthi]KLD77959.1 beta-lactamase [Xanthomonas hyacinthi DSM 19077]PPU96837.1 MBL fold metallo-hydrolase [Xanthomonas hyacinthi]QGY76209.1 MBL fold metallo-hydrolase [Xanthomonas hyacinthi]
MPSFALPRLGAALILALGIAGAAAAHAATGAPVQAHHADTATQPAAAPLQVQVYHPDAHAIFGVASVLVSGSKDAVLVDAQFAAADARALVAQIRASCKRLTTIYISHGDPDYYFGLDVLTQAFPQAKLLASPATVAHIRQTQTQKLQVWAPKLGADAPQRIVLPQPLRGDRLLLEGRELRIVGLDGATPDRTFVWIPSIKTVLGGIPVVAGEHVWMADTQTPASHAQWLATLQRIQALQPQRVIPGHFVPGAAQDLAAVRFTADYIRAFDEETAKAKDAAALVAAMQQRYPQLGGVDALQLSAQVAKGEMRWP